MESIKMSILIIITIVGNVSQGTSLEKEQGLMSLGKREYPYQRNRKESKGSLRHHKKASFLELKLIGP